MVKFTKYLSICVILMSSRFIGATKLPAEDCDYDKETGSDYFASGSAHSSQFLMPDGSVQTNSKGSSVSSDGIQRTFHELKKEANKYVSKSSSDGLTIPDGAIIPEIPGSHFSQFFKNNPAFSAGEQGSFSSSHSGSEGSSQYFDQKKFSQLPTDSKITTFKKQEVKQVVTKSSSGLSSNPGVTGEFDVEQNQGANYNANVDSLIYKPAGAAVQNGYSSNHHQESGSLKVSSSNVNPEPDTGHQTIYYRPTPLKLYEREDDHGSEGIRVSGATVNNPSTYAGKTIIYPSVQHSGASSSSSVHKVESYSQGQHDANADIPSYLVNKPNTYSANVVDLDKIRFHDSAKQYWPIIIPTKQVVTTTENHYGSESFSEHIKQKETKHYAVPAVTVVPIIPNPINDNEEVESLRPEELDGYGNKRVILSSEKLVVVPNTNGHHATFHYKVQVPTETVGSSQTYQKKTQMQSVKTFASGRGADSAVLSESDVHKNEGAARPVSLGAPQSQTGEHFAENEQKSGDTVTIPILLHGVPQNTGYYSSKSGSSSSHSSSSGSQLGLSSGGSQHLKYTGDATSIDASNLFGNSDKFSIPIQTYVSPGQTYVSPVQTYVSPKTSSKSSSSSSYHYFSSNGQAGEQLVPNSNIFANSDSSSIQQNHASLLQNLGKSNIGSDAEFVHSSFGTPQKKTYGFSTAYSSQSSNINGKVTENREASVAVNDNGKLDSYHVKS